MNVKEMIEWLKQFPEDTIVEVLVEEDSRSYNNYTTSSWVELEGRDYNDPFEFIDFTNNPHVKEGESHFGKKFLQLGCK